MVGPKGLGETGEAAAALVELDAVVEEAETAAAIIMDAAEAIEAMIRGRVGDPALARRLNDAVVRIYAACSFADLVEQRVGNLTATLHPVEPQALLAGGAPMTARRQAVIDALFAPRGGG